MQMISIYSRLLGAAAGICLFGLLGCPGTGDPGQTTETNPPGQPHLNEGPAIPEQGPNPDIAFDFVEYSFGKVNTNQTVKMAYPFKNIGDRMLNIERVKAG